MTRALAEQGRRPAVSVVIPTWRRPEYLRQALRALSRQTFSGFEVIVVGDAPGPVGCGAPPDLADKVIYLRADAPNVSRSRNLGLARANGGIIAFMDDDATPSPHWLERLVAPFADPAIGAAGGRLLDPRGLSDVGVLAAVDARARERPITIDERAAPAPVQAPEGWFPSVIGANCAFRRHALAEVGGFDEAYAYFLDETELCARLHRAGWGVAAAPLAEVIHWRAPGDHRKANGAPRSLFETGASLAVFLRIHAGPERAPEAIAAFRAERSVRLEQMRVQGRLTMDEARAVLASFDAGIEDGCGRASVAPSVPRDPPTGAARGALWSGGGPRVAVLAPIFSSAAARRLTSVLAADGADVTLVTVKPTRRPLEITLRRGVWSFACGAHQGGTARFGAVSVSDLMRVCSFRGVQMVARPHRRALGRAGRGAIRMEGPGEGFVIEPLDETDEGCAAALAALATRCASAA